MTAVDFGSRIRETLDNPQIYPGYQRITDELVLRRTLAFKDPREFAELRGYGAALRANALSKLPFLLELLERKCLQNGIKVHWAENGEDANRIILDLLLDHGIDSILSGRSQTLEEIGLRDFLQLRGIRFLPGSLAEFIHALAAETPSATLQQELPKTSRETVELLRQHFPDMPVEDSIESVQQALRKILRQRVGESRVAVTGVNFAVAETGTLCLVEDEGNLRLSTMLPDMHIAVAGLEKVTESFADLPTLLNLLTRSANGRTSAGCINFISSPRKTTELDGPRQVHLILLDNGRSKLYAEKKLLGALRCIRCDACSYECPVYSRVGEQVMGGHLPGPVGVVMGQFIPESSGSSEDLLNSNLCGACDEVCPVQVQLTSQIGYLRQRDAGNKTPLVDQSGLDVRVQKLGWRLWGRGHRGKSSYWLLHRLLNMFRHTRISKFFNWQELPVDQKSGTGKSLRRRLSEMGVDSE